MSTIVFSNIQNTEPRPPILDVHAHTFNLADLPASGFIRWAFAQTDEPLSLTKPLDPLIDVVIDAIEAGASSGPKERAVLQNGLPEHDPESDDSPPDVYIESVIDGIGRLEHGDPHSRRLVRELREQLAQAQDDTRSHRALDAFVDAYEAAAANRENEVVEGVPVEGFRSFVRTELARLAASDASADLRLASDVVASLLDRPEGAMREELAIADGAAGLRTLDMDYLVMEADSLSLGSSLRKLLKSAADWIEKAIGVVVDSVANFLKTVWKGGKKALLILFELGGTALRYIRWIGLLQQFRYEITHTLVARYSRGQGFVDAYVPHLVDFSYWLDGETPRTSIRHQCELMALNAKPRKGAILPFVGYNPLRDLRRKRVRLENGTLVGAALGDVMLAVEQYGFLGVKLYPPMGFAAIGNADMEFHPDDNVDGAKLDEALRAFYSYCAKNHVPILAHCAPSNESREMYYGRPHPRHWRALLEEPDFRELHVCLGHFGGDEWANDVSELIETGRFPNVFTDFGHETDIEAHAREIQRRIESCPTLEQRIMYGSDWIMIARTKEEKTYFERYARALWSDTADGKKRFFRLMGWNAVEFLGLRRGERNRARVHRFYGRPRWLQRIDDYAPHA